MSSNPSETSATDTNEDDNNNNNNNDITFGKRGCCFWIPCLGTQRASTVGSIWWQRIKTVETSHQHDPWWARGWKRLRHWSEIIAGPKWKTFIRRFNKNQAGNNTGVGGSKLGKFQYDPLSYSLNFDEGPEHFGHFYDEDCLKRDFSSRYASLPSSVKCSMDLGKDAPLFT